MSLYTLLQKTISIITEQYEGLFLDAFYGTGTVIVVSESFSNEFGINGYDHGLFFFAVETRSTYDDPVEFSSQKTLGGDLLLPVS